MLLLLNELRLLTNSSGRTVYINSGTGVNLRDRLKFEFEIFVLLKQPKFDFCLFYDLEINYLYLRGDLKKYFVQL